jgi:hypothetical protein
MSVILTTDEERDIWIGEVLRIVMRGADKEDQAAAWVRQRPPHAESSAADLGWPLIFFASGFVLVEAFGNVGSDGRIVGVCDRCAVLLLDFFALGIHRKIIGL